MNIRVSEVELARENVESVALPEDGGYLAWIGAFHQLHCLVRRRVKRACQASNNADDACRIC